MDSPIEEAEKLAAEKKAAVRFLKHRAKHLAESMAKGFAGGFFTLAAADSKQLASVLEVLSQIDISQ